VVRLKDLQTSRARLIKQLTSNRVYLGELKGVSDPLIYGAMEKAYKAAIEGLEKSIGVIEEQIKAIVAKDESMKQNYKLLISVPGIGHVTAVYLLCCTANFAARPTGKQLACYAGVAPFGYSSGTSIRGRARVHRMANKELKRLLYMGARAAVQHNPEMKAYYERKKSEGKHDLTVINAVKNKIILRVAAVIARQRPFVQKAALAA
jgi:transposase